MCRQMMKGIVLAPFERFPLLPTHDRYDCIATLHSGHKPATSNPDAAALAEIA